MKNLFVFIRKYSFPVLTTYILAIVLLNLHTSREPGELINSQELGQHTILTYRTNSQGMLGDYGIVIVEKKLVFPGLLVKKVLYTNRHNVETKVTLVADHTIHVALCLDGECKPEYQNVDINLR